MIDSNNIRKTNSFYWDTKGNEFIGAIALPLYGAFVSEEKCQLFGNVTGKKILEIGCGNGSSLQYMGERKASELFGVDISKNQLEIANQKLKECSISANLICSPMEEECGIPRDYFDYVYSIYAIGWTIDLEKTFYRIASYLKKDGVFIFSWTHPIHKCITTNNDVFEFDKSYFDDTWYPVPLDDGELTLCNRKLSTYVNALIKVGFIIEQIIEETDDELIKLCDENSNFAKRAKMFPVTFVIKAKKA